MNSFDLLFVFLSLHILCLFLLLLLYSFISFIPNQANRLFRVTKLISNIIDKLLSFIFIQSELFLGVIKLTVYILVRQGMANTFTSKYKLYLCMFKSRIRKNINIKFSAHDAFLKLSIGC